MKRKTLSPYPTAVGLALLGAVLLSPTGDAQQLPPGSIVFPGNGGAAQTVPQQGGGYGGYGGYGGRRGRRNRNWNQNGNGNGNGYNNGNGGYNWRNGNQNGNTGPQTNTEFVAASVISSAPTVANGDTVYVSSWNNKLYALDAKTGKQRWSFTAARLFNSSPAVGPDGTVYAASYDGHLYALDPKTGKQKWAFASTDVINSAPAVDAKGLVYVGSSDHTLSALDPANGKPKWQFKTNAAVSTPVLGPDNTVYMGADAIYAVDTTTGKPKWNYVTDIDPEAPVALGPDGTLYAVGKGGTLVALDSKTGARKWKATFPEDIEYAPVATADRVYVGADKLYALRASDGRPMWQFGTTSATWSTPSLGPNGTLYVGNDDRMVYAVSGTSGTMNWGFKTDDLLISFPQVGPDGVVYLSAEGNQKTYALNARTGRMLWQFTQDPVPPATPTNNGGYGGRQRGG